MKYGVYCVTISGNIAIVTFANDLKSWVSFLCKFERLRAKSNSVAKFCMKEMQTGKIIMSANY